MRLPSGEGRVTIEEITQRAASAGTRLVRCLYCDNGGVIRGKAIHPRLLPQVAQGGVGLMQAVQAQTPLDRLVPTERLGPVGEVRLRPDLATFVVLPYGTRLAALLCDLTTPDGTAWPLCPRTFLRASRSIWSSRSAAGRRIAGSPSTTACATRPMA